MIVCHCPGVTDREIRACVQQGARTCGDVGNECGAGTGCGGCASLVADVVAGEKRRLAVLRSDVAASPMACLTGMADAAPAMAG